MKIEVGEGQPHEILIPDVETASESYARRFQGPVGNWLLKVQASAALSLLSDITPSHLSVLDVGGGHHQLTAPLAGAGHDVVIHGSRMACHKQMVSSPVPLVVSDLCHLPFAEGSFDLVVGIRLLAHVEQENRLLEEMTRVSSKLVMIDFPVQSALHRAAPFLFRVKSRWEGNTRPYFQYSLQAVDRRLRDAGLQRVGLVRQFFLPMALHRALGRPQISRRLETAAARAGLTKSLGSPAILVAARLSVQSLPNPLNGTITTL